MKKILMTLAAVAVATTMNAQVYLGGTLGFTQDHASNSKVSTNMFTVSPEIGYNLNEKFAVGAALGYTYEGTTGAAHKNTWKINPYLRYTFVKAGNFSAFADGGLEYETAHTKGLKKNTNTFGFRVNPGIAYNVSEKVTLVAHLKNGLYFNHSWNGEFAGDDNYPVQASSHANHWGLDFSSLKLQIGAYYNF
jgi:opacity protein-like surface antigen